jgi:23S rRNA pseudouridine1911/1915/1917 synthase
VRVNGTAVTRVSEPVAGGEQVIIDVPPPAPARPIAQDLPLTIVYQDDDIVVVDKPAGMVVHPAAGHAKGTLVNVLLHMVEDLSGVGGEVRPGIVHRLDKGTSGLMVVAKHDLAHLALTRQFSGRAVRKIYVALVWGAVEGGRRIETLIGRDPHHRQRMSVRPVRGRDAVTEIVRADPLRGVTLVQLAIATGRTHQIRVHLQSIGHPVVGDDLYGGLRRQLPADLRVLRTLERPFLHAAKLAFAHPTTGEWLEFEAPLPEDLVHVLAALRSAST